MLQGIRKSGDFSSQLHAGAFSCSLEMTGFKAFVLAVIANKWLALKNEAAFVSNEVAGAKKRSYLSSRTNVRDLMEVLDHGRKKLLRIHRSK